MKKIQLLLLFISLFVYMLPTNAQKLKGNLLVGSKTKSNIQINDLHKYNVFMKKGEFGLINLIQKGMDVKIVTYNPDGKEIEEFDSPNGSFGNELILIDANQSGTYVLKVIPLAEDKEEKSGSYTLELISKNENINSHLDEGFELISDGNYLPGFFVSIVNDKKIIYTNGKGFANIKEQIPYTVNTIQQIESISKTFLGLSIMLLVEEGKLDLDKDINTYLPFKVRNPFFPRKSITLRHLATHTASIDDRELHEKISWIENKEVFLKNKDKYIHEERRVFYESIMSNTEISMEAFLKSFFIPKEEAKGLSLSDKSVRTRIVNDSLKGALKANPSPIYDKAFTNRITTGTIEDDLHLIADSDWIIEVVVENLEVKHKVFAQVEKHRKPGSIISSNTSGIPIHMMAQGRSEDFQQHFCGTHFFNPPRYLELLEIIPTKHTKKQN